ncbi:MAG: DUF1553 domain-containing protein [Gemmataceae bacterium]
MWLFVLSALLTPTFRTDGDLDFDRTVAPLLAERCLDCHTGAEGKGKLDLSTKAGITKGGKGGPAVVARNLADSLLWQRIDADEMPPKHPLPANERAVLKRWIEQGAKWGTDPIDPHRMTTSNRAGTDWWSLQPLTKPTPPRKIGHPIDAFVDQVLDVKHLTRSAPADRRTFIRRVTFDLIGLPPTREEIQNYLSDTSPDADRKLVDRLLASPHYGERWARHWLDVAHFGESDGYEFDKMRPNAWRFRDWVIRALNNDMPFDQFAKWQIAGDVLAPNNADAIVATGFLVGGAHDSLLPAGDVMKQIMRQDELEDLVGIVGQSFLGVTIHCARCHDHKFDPIRQTDYYRLASSLAGVQRGDRTIPLEAPADLLKRIEQTTRDLLALENPIRDRILADRASGAKAKPVAPRPISSWDFSQSLRDTVGELHGTAFGQARIVDGALKLDGKSYVQTRPLTKSINEKTFEAWVKLDKLEQRGGGVIGIQQPDGNVFDCLVYGEREPGRWMAGSEGFTRTVDFQAYPEQEANRKFVHVAITYDAKGMITGYREGKPYGKSFRIEAAKPFDAGRFLVQFGVRHTPADDFRTLKGSILRANLYDRALSAEEIAISAGAASFITETELSAAMTPAQRSDRARWIRERDESEARIREYRDAKSFAITPQKPGVTHRLKRGNPGEKAEVVSAGGIAVLPGFEFGLPAEAKEADRRIHLANWIASEKNPLFARTIVNRVWQYHFGRGLVETPNDLGFSGGKPSHPELLDWLANELIARRWSLKQLHRIIVTSETYRQASLPNAKAVAIDADNRLLWRYSPHRLEAEALRDATLSVSGQLNPAVGGKGYMDVRPFIFRTSQFYELLDVDSPEFNRRSVYRMCARGGKNPLLETFDCPDTATTTPKRASTTTPLQALSLMNNSFTLRMADHFADRLQREAGKNPDDQIRLAFELAYGRTVKDSELAASREVVSTRGLSTFCRALLNTNGFLYVH